MEGFKRLDFLYGYLDQNLSLTRELTEDFLRDAETFLPELEQFTEGQQCEKALKTLHRIKANLELFGMDAEKQQIEQLESAQRQQDPPAGFGHSLQRVVEGIRGAITEIREDYQRLQAQAT